MNNPTYVLIPGAWHGAWSWQPVATRLRRAGYEAIALTLPGLAHGDDPSGHRLEDAVAYIVDEVTRRELTDVVLVAHSWGGYPCTGAAHLLADRVSKAVFFNGLLPTRGKSLVEDNSDEQREIMMRLISDSPSGAIAPALEFVEQLFMPGAARELQRLVADLLTPQPGGYFLDVLDAPDVTTLGIATAYILSEQNHANPRSGDAFAAQLGVKPILVPGTHESMLTHPDEAANAILAA